MCMACAQRCPQRPEKRVRYPEVSELLDMGAEKRTQLFWTTVFLSKPSPSPFYFV